MKKIYVIGTGMGSRKLLTSEALEKIEKAQLFIGATRMAESYGKEYGVRWINAVSTEDILKAVEEADVENIAVLMSGDTGYFSGARKLAEKLTEHVTERKSDIEFSLIPGISCLQYFASKLFIPWDNIKSVSVHGRDDDPISYVLTEKNTFFLLGGNMTAADICKRLEERGLGHITVYIGERLSYSDEKITIGAASEFTEKDFDNLSVMIVENKDIAENSIVTHGIPDSSFIRGNIPMTKEEIRSVSLSKLRLEKRSVVWDIGAGTGSVTVESALQASEGHVIAVELEEEGANLVRRNVDKFGLQNVTVIEGKAPEVLNGLPAPDRVFIGGSKGNLKEIICAALKMNSKVRVVINAITLETLMEAMRIFSEKGFENLDITEIFVSRTVKAGRYNMMKGMNPVYIISGEGESCESK